MLKLNADFLNLDVVVADEGHILAGIDSWQLKSHHTSRKHHITHHISRKMRSTFKNGIFTASGKIPNITVK